MKKINVVVDFDGVITDSAKTILDMYKEQYNVDFEYKPKDLMWDFSPYVRNDEEKKYCVSCFSNPELYERIEPLDIKNIKEFLLYCKDNNYRTILCSRRPQNGYDPCFDFLKKNGIEFDDIVFTNNFDKSIVGGPNSIIIDDQTRCMGGNRIMKFLFGHYGYQDEYRSYEFVPVRNWEELMAKFKEIDETYLRHIKEEK